MTDRTESWTRHARRRVRYRLDNLLARGTWAPLLVLGGITLVVVVIASAVLSAFGVTLSGSQDGSWFEDLWQSLLRVLDTGTMAADTGWGQRFLALLVTIVGLLILGTLIGLIASGVEQRVASLRRGRSAVIESDHVVILGESDRLPIVVRQLALAGRHRRGTNTVVILADTESDHLGDEVRAAISDLRGTRIVLRRGHPARRSDLALVAVAEARCVIVLADEDDHGDAAVIKAVLAAGAELGGFRHVPILAEVHDPETAATLVEACDGNVYPAAGLQAVARIAAFSLRETGLHQVVNELLDFNGADIYVRPPGETHGVSFADCVARFEATRVLGTLDPSGEISLNPTPETPIGPEDRLIVIADDNAPPEPTNHPVDLTTSPAPRPPGPSIGPSADQEHHLIIGWNALGEQLVSELTARAAPGSSLEIVYDPKIFDPDEILLPPHAAFGVTMTPSRTPTWRWEDPAGAPTYDSIVLLGYRRSLSIDEADSRTLLNLLMLQRQLAASGPTRPRLIVELLDPENVDLVSPGSADDIISSDAIVSRLIAQLADQPARRPILLALYATGGPSIHLVSTASLGLEGEVTFGSVVATAYRTRLLAIGWFHGAANERKLTLNPSYSDILALSPGDQIVVIGEVPHAPPGPSPAR